MKAEINNLEQALRETQLVLFRLCAATVIRDGDKPALKKALDQAQYILDKYTDFSRVLRTEGDEQGLPDAWCVFNDLSPEFDMVVRGWIKKHYPLCTDSKRSSRFVGISEHGTLHFSAMPFGEQITLSQFKELTTQKINHDEKY